MPVAGGWLVQGQIGFAVAVVPAHDQAGRSAGQRQRWRAKPDHTMRFSARCFTNYSVKIMVTES